MAHACSRCSAYWDGTRAGLAGVKEQPHGLGEPLIASSASINADEGHTGASKTQQEPAVPLKDADQEPTSDTVKIRSGTAEASTVQHREQKNLLGGAVSYVQEGRGKPAQHALPGASHKWAQYESSSAPPGQQSPEAKPLTTLQAGSLPTTHAAHSIGMLCLSSCMTASAELLHGAPRTFATSAKLGVLLGLVPWACQ